MKAFYTDQYVLPLPEGHRFPMRKYRLTRDYACARVPDLELLPPPAATHEDLCLAHSASYVDAVFDGTLSPREQREIGFPWSPAMVERSRRSVGATIAASRVARIEGIAVNLAGGTHHAYADKGSGFCVFNDVAVATRLMHREQGLAGQALTPVAIIDLDVHQGNGTASILAGDAQVFTLSLHGEKNFPFRKEASDLDIGLPDGCDDATYLLALSEALDAMLARFTPGFVFYLAGADPYSGDRLGRLGLSIEGLAARDRRVFESLRERAPERGVPIAVMMAGGYGRVIEETCAIHAQTIAIAAQFSKAFGVRATAAFEH
ncbi:MAG: histone deacetylase family protein [Burkholderiaceae bacterium]